MVREIIAHHQALVRVPGPNIVSGISQSGLAVPNFELALAQHRRYCEALETCGIKLITLPFDPRFPDGCFVEDTAVIFEGTAIITNPGHAARKDEPHEIAKALSTLKELKNIKDPGTVDGGDILRVENHFFIGISKRTNQNGAEQLSALLTTCGATCSIVEVGESLHLKSDITCVNADTVICTEEYAGNSAFRDIANRIVVSDDEKHAANCLSANGSVFVPDDCVQAQAELQKVGMRVIPLDLSEFRKLDGAFTCLSLLL